MLNEIIENFPNIPNEWLALLKCKDNDKDKMNDRYFDLHWENRQQLTRMLFPVYTARHKPLLRFLIEQEIECCVRYDFDDCLLRALAFMLYTVADIEDAELLYRTKFECTFDASFNVDIELIFGDDKDEIKRYYADKNQDLVDVIKLYETRPFRNKADYIARVQQHNLMDYWLAG